MTKTQKNQMTKMITESAAIFYITPTEKTSTYNFNHGYLTALCVAAELAGVPVDEIDTAKQIGLDHATPSQYNH